MLDPLFLAWAAGFFDGEGCVMVEMSKEKGCLHGYRTSLHTNVTQTSLPCLQLFLENFDYFKTSPNDKSTFNFIKKEGIFMDIVYEKDLKDFVINWIEENQAPEGVFNLMTGHLMYFKREFLSMLQTREIKTLKDTKDECFIFY